jgi:hypothetical protein
MELVIYKPTNDQFVKTIDFNFDELKKEITNALEKYQGRVYSDESIKDAKSDRATLNKFKEALESKRKEVKKQCLAPYEAFEKKIKELTALVDEPILAIDGQVKSYEQAKKDEKKAAITEYYEAHIGDLAPLLPLERVFNEKWLNATVKINAAQEEIDALISRIALDLQTISGLKSEFEVQIKDVYLRTLDLSAALNEKTRQETIKSEQEEYKRKKEAERVEFMAAPVVEAVIIDSEPVYIAPVQELCETPKTIKVIFYDTTEAFRADMRALTEKHGITYGGIQ